MRSCDYCWCGLCLLVNVLLYVAAHGLLYYWTWNSCENFGSQKLTEISKSHTKTSKHLKKLWWFWKFEGFSSKTEGVAAICILNSKWPPLAQFWSYKKVLYTFFHQKIISTRVYFLNFCSSLTGFWVISKNAILRSYSPPRYAQKWQICAYLGGEYGRDIAVFEITEKPVKLEQKFIKYTLAEIIVWCKNV